MQKSEKTAACWNSFRRASGLTTDHYEVVSFGDSPAMADALADLVVNGPKRATAGLKRDFELSGEPWPVVGGHVVVVDGQGEPRCIWRTTEVTIKPLIEVDAQFAWDEAEGDRTLADWLDGHRAFFQRQAGREGFVFHDRIETVFERFVVVWPQQVD
jgi:uncharacterized protein YhfF